MKKGFHSKHIYNNWFMKTKVKSCSDETTDFHDEEVSKVGCNYICLAVILINLVF